MKLSNHLPGFLYLFVGMTSNLVFLYFRVLKYFPLHTADLQTWKLLSIGFPTPGTRIRCQILVYMRGWYRILLTRLLYTVIGTTLQTPPPLFDLKIVYSYVIEVPDSESDLGLHGKALVSEIFAFYHLLKIALRRPGCRAHVHLILYIAIEGFEGVFTVLYCIYVWG